MRSFIGDTFLLAIAYFNSERGHMCVQRVTPLRESLWELLNFLKVYEGPVYMKKQNKTKQNKQTKKTCSM